MANIPINRNPEMLLKLSEDIIRKHKKDGRSSPLVGIDMVDMEKQTKSAREKYTEAVELRKRSEKLTNEVQKLLGIHKLQKTTQPGHVLFYTTRVRDVLKGIFRDAVKKIGDWGFLVNERSGNNKIHNP
ncbi:MAG: hypothetical protein A3F72_16065 [Bacteroidetes bacterium RIFCSPLOWO2_12_FULL_35_15]|nr:MAG: hypothetical protein A3F72_16065 [Bacteroidetes bacterium RIFCSPLOWO2_12_FULL_35_15]